MPEWKSVLRTLQLPEKLLPRDVKTRWNSTYEMLRVAIEYRAAVDMLCMNKNNNLRSYELTPQEWKTAKQLRHILKVRLTVDRSPNNYKLTPTARARMCVHRSSKTRPLSSRKDASLI